MSAARWLAALVTLLALSCRRPAPAGTEAPAAVTAARPAAIPLLDPAALSARLAQERGKVLLVNLWASWCLPCVAEFGELDRFAGDYRDRGVRVLAISLDAPGSAATVRSFVAARKPSFEVVQHGSGRIADWVNPIDPGWEGSLPTTLVLDREGRLHARLVGAQKRQAFEQIVAPLVGSPRPGDPAP